MSNLRITERDHRRLKEQAKKQGMTLPTYAGAIVRGSLPMTVTVWQSKVSRTWHE